MIGFTGNRSYSNSNTCLTIKYLLGFLLHEFGYPEGGK